MEARIANRLLDWLSLTPIRAGLMAVYPPFLPQVSGTASGLFPRPARCGASASLRASGLRSPEEFQNAP